ncbi:MAG: hypothetical protein FD138_3108 [Planctomycetota bacterium]|nr:MAG: hypothetical protein FD138_3108 [Planctomycetota bacterium]
MIPQSSETRSVLEMQLLDPATTRVLVTIPSPGPTWGNYSWRFSSDGNTLAVHDTASMILSEEFGRPVTSARTQAHRIESWISCKRSSLVDDIWRLNAYWPLMRWSAVRERDDGHSRFRIE